MADQLQFGFTRWTSVLVGFWFQNHKLLPYYFCAFHANGMLENEGEIKISFLASHTIQSSF